MRWDSDRCDIQGGCGCICDICVIGAIIIVIDRLGIKKGWETRLPTHRPTKKKKKGLTQDDCKYDFNDHRTAKTSLLELARAHIHTYNTHGLPFGGQP